MQKLDKDLASIQEVRDLMQKAKNSWKKLSEMNQEQVDKIVYAIAMAGEKNASKLAKMANEETGFGIYEDKIIKNVFASKGVYDAIKDIKTVGIIASDEKLKTRDIGVPMGVVAGIIPSTNPTSTVIYKAMISIKAGNAIVISPHPGALKCILETVNILRDAILSAGGDADLLQSITIPTLGATKELMSHIDTAIILATGGSAMVKSAYSSGNPALGVGPGNGPAFIERSANLKLAVGRIMDSKTFDNGTICASEQSIICEEDMHKKIVAEMEAQGAYFLSNDEKQKLSSFILRGNGTMNPAIVGKSVQVIASLAGLNVPKSTRVLVAYEDGIGKGHPYSNEKLCPILGFYIEKDYKAVCDRSIEILTYEGAGHTFSMHSENEDIINYFAKRIPVSRFLVNTPSALGGVGATTSLMPSYTLGCGAIGGSSTSDNIGPLNLLNIRKVAYGTKELSDIRASINTSSNTMYNTNNSVDIDLIVKKIIEKLSNN